MCLFKHHAMKTQGKWGYSAMKNYQWSRRTEANWHFKMDAVEVIKTVASSFVQLTGQMELSQLTSQAKRSPSVQNLRSMLVLQVFFSYKCNSAWTDEMDVAGE
jgi:hypothetical protein